MAKGKPISAGRWVYKTGLWQRLRAEQLRQHPLCRYCLAIGIVTAADTVDHIKAHCGDRALAFDPDNLQSLCKACHDKHAQAKDRGLPIAGCDADGYPLDGNHPWAEKMAIGGHQTTGKNTSDNWLTPPGLLSLLGNFDLDPCGYSGHLTANKIITLPDNGLDHQWKGTVWLNPPYSNITPWMERLSKHGSGMALVFARTEVAWFRDFVWNKADSMLFLFGRIYFWTPEFKKAKGNAGAPSVLIAYGGDCVERLKNIKKFGGHVDINRT